MTPKISLILGLAVFAFGAFVGNRFKENAPPLKIEQSQQQAQGQSMNQESTQDCQAEVSKVTHPDGSVEEFFKLRSSAKLSQASSQDQTQAQVQKITPEDSSIDVFGGGGAGNQLKPMASVEVIFGKHSVEYISNGHEWIGLYKIRLLQF